MASVHVQHGRRLCAALTPLSTAQQRHARERWARMDANIALSLGFQTHQGWTTFASAHPPQLQHIVAYTAFEVDRTSLSQSSKTSGFEDFSQTAMSLAKLHAGLRAIRSAVVQRFPQSPPGCGRDQFQLWDLARREDSVSTSKLISVR